MDRQPPATEPRRDAVGALELGGDVAALPGDEAAARLEEREGELDETTEVRDRAGGHDRPALSTGRIASQRLGPDGGDADAPGEPGRSDRDLEEARLLGGRLDEQRIGRDGGRERDARVATTRPEVEQAAHAEVSQERRRPRANRGHGGSRRPTGSRIEVRLIASVQASSRRR